MHIMWKMLYFNSFQLYGNRVEVDINFQHQQLYSMTLKKLFMNFDFFPEMSNT